MRLEKLDFVGATGDRLAAWLSLPDEGTAHTYAVIAHCFACNKNYHAVSNISRALSQAGIAALRFDFTGLGESEGEFANTNFSSNTEDVLAAYRFLSSQYQAPDLLIGHSLGGAAVLKAARQLPKVKAVVTVAAPSETKQVAKMLVAGGDQQNGDLEVMIGGGRFRITRQLLDDLEKTRMQTHIHDLGHPLLVLHSPQDKTVNVSNGLQIFEWAQHPKSFVSLNQADHLLSDRNDSFYAAEVIATWVSTYLGKAQ